MRIPQVQREAVNEVTMDFSDSMYAIVKEAFPNAAIVIDCFQHGQASLRWTGRDAHAIQAQGCHRARAYYQKKYPRKRGEKRGRPRMRSNEKFKPSALSNGDTKVELLTRARYILPKSGDKWSENQKKRAGLLFELQPKLNEAYSIVCQLRCIFKNRKLTKTQAKERMREWYKAVSSFLLKGLIQKNRKVSKSEIWIWRLSIFAHKPRGYENKEGFLVPSVVGRVFY